MFFGLREEGGEPGEPTEEKTCKLHSKAPNRTRNLLFNFTSCCLSPLCHQPTQSRPQGGVSLPTSTPSIPLRILSLLKHMFYSFAVFFSFLSPGAAFCGAPTHARARTHTCRSLLVFLTVQKRLSGASGRRAVSEARQGRRVPSLIDQLIRDAND